EDPPWGPPVGRCRSYRPAPRAAAWRRDQPAGSRACGTPSATSKMPSSPVASRARVTIREPGTSRSVCRLRSASSLAATSTARPAEPRNVTSVRSRTSSGTAATCSSRRVRSTGAVRVSISPTTCTTRASGPWLTTSNRMTSPISSFSSLVPRSAGMSPLMHRLLDVGVVDTGCGLVLASRRSTLRTPQGDHNGTPLPRDDRRFVVAEDLVVVVGHHRGALEHDPRPVGEDHVARDVDVAVDVDVDAVAAVLAERVRADGGQRRLADDADPVLGVAPALVVLDEVVLRGLGDADARLDVVVHPVAADDVVMGLVDVDALRGIGERVVVLDGVPVRAQVEHDAVVVVAVHHVLPHHAVHAVLGEDDPVLAVVVDEVA